VPEGRADLGTVPKSSNASTSYLNEVDKMLERAKEVTRNGRWTQIEYAQFADDLVTLGTRTRVMAGFEWRYTRGSGRSSPTASRGERGQDSDRGSVEGRELRLPWI